MNKRPDPSVPHPLPGAALTYIKPTLTRKNIIAGEFSYYSGEDFESRVTHHYEFYGDRLIIGKFCQIAAGVEFVMNGANHMMGGASTFPFSLFAHWDAMQPSLEALHSRGDTVVGNDVWIGQNATILPGVHIGDGAIIGANAVVGRDVEPYVIAAGNPAKPLRKRFDDELIALLEQFLWWDRPVGEIQELIPLLVGNDLDRVRRELTERLKREGDPIEERLTLRLERPADYEAVERLTFAAFETMELPGRTRTAEHFLVRLLRDDPNFLPELDFVAERGGKIVGSIFYSRCAILRPDGAVAPALVFGPVSVQPELHGRGIGSAIIRHSLSAARALGHKAVLITGHPEYYRRFGFVPASAFGLTTLEGDSFDAFMALELEPGFLGHSGGRWKYCEAFARAESDEAGLLAYEKELGGQR